MITSIELENFKLYRNAVSFNDLGKITILTGINGRGKSTFLHPMLLLKQSLFESEWNNALILNGDYLELGNASDVKNDKAGRSSRIKMGFKANDAHIEMFFNSENDNAQKLDLVELCINSCSYGSEVLNITRNFIPNDKEFANTSLMELFSSVRYISAERIGPELRYLPPKTKNYLDATGKFAPYLLDMNKNKPVSKEMLEGLMDIFPGTDVENLEDKSIIGLTQFWLSKMFEDTKVRTEYLIQADIYVLYYMTAMSSCWSKPTNVGFGYSYTLPIIVAGLTSTTGSTLIIENPEAHLHPKAQSILGKFLSWIAKYNDIQIFIETHSEHIVNSFRVSVKQKIITPLDLCILFFDKKMEHFAKKISIDSNGYLNDWPENFFDQEERDLDTLL